MLTKLIARVQAYVKSEEGATAIEYGLIASLIAVAIFAVLLTVGDRLTAVFTTVESNLKTS